MAEMNGFTKKALFKVLKVQEMSDEIRNLKGIAEALCSEGKIIVPYNEALVSHLKSYNFINVKKVRSENIEKHLVKVTADIMKFEQSELYEKMKELRRNAIRSRLSELIDLEHKLTEEYMMLV